LLKSLLPGMRWTPGELMLIMDFEIEAFFMNRRCASSLHS
jgi:hypothetical protein